MRVLPPIVVSGLHSYVFHTVIVFEFHRESKRRDHFPSLRRGQVPISRALPDIGIWVDFTCVMTALISNNLLLWPFGAGQGKQTDCHVWRPRGVWVQVLCFNELAARMWVEGIFSQPKISAEPRRYPLRPPRA